jgi:hypothetical protein
MGIHDIPEFIIKKCHSQLATALTHIINQSFSSGYFPDQLFGNRREYVLNSAREQTNYDCDKHTFMCNFRFSQQRIWNFVSYEALWSLPKFQRLLVHPFQRNLLKTLVPNYQTVRWYILDPKYLTYRFISRIPKAVLITNFYVFQLPSVQPWPSALTPWLIGCIGTRNMYKAISWNNDL